MRRSRRRAARDSPQRLARPRLQVLLFTRLRAAGAVFAASRAGRVTALFAGDFGAFAATGRVLLVFLAATREGATCLLADFDEAGFVAADGLAFDA